MIEERTHSIRPWHFDRHNSFLDNANSDTNDVMRSNRVGFVAIGGGAEVKNNNVFHVNINLTINGPIEDSAKQTVKELLAEIRSLTGAAIKTPQKNNGKQPRKGFWKREKKDE